MKYEAKVGRKLDLLCPEVTVTPRWPLEPLEEPRESHWASNPAVAKYAKWRHPINYCNHKIIKFNLIFISLFFKKNLVYFIFRYLDAYSSVALFLLLLLLFQKNQREWWQTQNFHRNYHYYDTYLFFFNVIKNIYLFILIFIIVILKQRQFIRHCNYFIIRDYLYHF